MAIQSQIIKDLITNFNLSDIKRKMIEGERYFRNQNDILKKDLKSYKVYDKNTGNTVTKTNENKSDQHLPHGSYTKQVNQKKS